MGLTTVYPLDTFCYNENEYPEDKNYKLFYYRYIGKDTIDKFNIQW